MVLLLYDDLKNQPSQRQAVIIPPAHGINDVSIGFILVSHY